MAAKASSTLASRSPRDVSAGGLDSPKLGPESWVVVWVIEGVVIEGVGSCVRPLFAEGCERRVRVHGIPNPNAPTCFSPVEGEVPERFRHPANGPQVYPNGYGQRELLARPLPELGHERAPPRRSRVHLQAS